MKRDTTLLDNAAAPWPEPHPFDNERLWLDCLLEREILRLRARYELSLDELRGLYISDRQVDELLRRQAEHMVPAADAELHDPVLGLTRQAAQWRAHFAADSPLAMLGERLDLSDADLELLFVVGAPELDLRYETLYAYLNNDIGRKTATVDMARRLLDGEDGVRRRAATLLGMGLLESPDAEERRSSLCQSLTVARPLVRFLLGIGPQTRATHACGCIAEPLLESIPGAGASAPSDGAVIACRGDDPERQTAWATQLLTARGRHGLHVTPEMLVNDEAVLLARLAGASLILHEPASVTRDPAVAERLARALQGLTDKGHSLLWLVPSGWQAGPAFAHLPLTTLDLPPCSTPERAATWTEALRQAFLCDDLDLDEMANSLASRFSFSGLRIKLAVHGAQAALGAAVAPTQADRNYALARSARQLASRSLAQVAQHATKPHRWPQLVLSATTMQLLREIAGAIGARERVFHEWNMQGRTGRSAGLMMLFAGASGTGKTMAASVLANHVGLDLFRIDLASVVSKYIGETEKNLDRIFTTAQDADAILLFDEADALLGKRSEVKDAHDRYANIEVAYLLQKMEEHDGVVILASNLPKNLDQAFSRRMHYVVEFSRPNATLREQLWRGMFPAEVPLADDIDYGFLGEQFDLMGGDIQTIALEAAFLAAGDGNRLGMTQLMRAIARRQTKHGDPGVAARFRVHQETLELGRV
jgi:hypothetical protein